MTRSNWLSDTDLTTVQQATAGLTPGTYGVGVHRARRRWQAVWWIAKSIFKRPSADMHLIYAETPAEGQVFIAVTGNAPNSPRNAAALCALMQTAPYLLAEVQARRHPISAVTVPKHPPEAPGMA
jgi:hypothetical protein